MIERPMYRDVPALRRALLAWHRRHAQPAPWRDARDPYLVLIAATMAQQTQMSRVLPRYESFVAAFPTIELLAAASTAGVLRAWAGLGYNMRALRLQRAARHIADSRGWPREAAELERIEGIGPCTAAVIASFAFDRPAPAIDTNGRRVISRLDGGAGGPLPEREVRAHAEALVSRRAPGRWNQALMDLGALVCTARAPRCAACPLARWCRARPALARARSLPRAAEPRPSYRAQPPYRHSHRFYRGRIVDALRPLPDGASLSHTELLTRIRALTPDPSSPGRGESRLDRAGLRKIVASLRHDGLVRVQRGCVSLP
jgi:A/G-specific adenine glycosylase